MLPINMVKANNNRVDKLVQHLYGAGRSAIHQSNHSISSVADGVITYTLRISYVFNWYY
jgi:hypothetical protein